MLLVYQNLVLTYPMVLIVFGSSSLVECLICVRRSKIWSVKIHIVYFVLRHSNLLGNMGHIVVSNLCDNVFQGTWALYCTRWMLCAPIFLDSYVEVIKLSDVITICLKWDWLLAHHFVSSNHLVLKIYVDIKYTLIHEI